MNVIVAPLLDGHWRASCGSDPGARGGCAAIGSSRGGCAAIGSSRGGCAAIGSSRGGCAAIGSSPGGELLGQATRSRTSGLGNRLGFSDRMATDVPTTSFLRPLADDLRERREKIKLGGGPEKIEAQHAAEKLTARERIDLLIDDGTFAELGIHGRPHFSQRAMDGREAPADGVITGYGKVDGRLTAVAAYDFTVMAGSMGMTGELKVARLRELALSKRMPMIWLLDSAGARIQEAVGSLFAGSGRLFCEGVITSGMILQVA